MVTRRTVLAGLAGAMLSQLESLVFFPGLGRTSSAIAQDTADGDEYHGFLLLPWASPVPPDVKPPPRGTIPRTEGIRANATDERLSALDASRKYGIPIPLLDDVELRPTLTQVRAHAVSGAFWAETQYYAEGSKSVAVAVALRTAHPTPIPVWPGGSPESGLVDWDKVDYLPAPGLELEFGLSATAQWLDDFGLYVLTLDRALAPDWSLPRLVERLQIVKG